MINELYKEHMQALCQTYKRLAQNDYFPFNRAELEQYDPVTAKLMQEIWS